MTYYQKPTSQLVYTLHFYTKKLGRGRKTSRPNPPQRTTTNPDKLKKQKYSKYTNEAKLEPQTVDEASRPVDLQRGRSR
jgi:hypothetical protein